MIRYILLIASLLTLSACSTYRTPGAGVNIGDLSQAEEEIAEVMKREPAATFPARLAVARVQSRGYYTRNLSCYGDGPYCLVSTHEVETDDDFEKIRRLPMVSHLAPLNRMLLSENSTNMKGLRLAAARLKTDLLLLYSLDTRFNIDSTDVGPLALISLGFLPNKKAYVNATASAALVDVRSGFVYGVAESNAQEEQRATFWSSDDAVEKARLRAETDAFQGLLTEFETLWKDIAEEHGN